MSTSTALQTHLISTRPGVLAPGSGSSRLPVLPWRDPHSVPPEQLAEVIGSLQHACRLNPTNAELRVCLGIAHAMNYDAYKSMDALEAACTLEPRNFLAQFKYAELHYRLRALEVAEAETLKALDLASNHWELAQSRRQLSEIRRLTREGAMKPSWTKSLLIPVVCLGLILGVATVLFTVIR